MELTLANPYGLLALLSLPTIVWLHRFVLWGLPKQVSCLELWEAPENLQSEGKQRRSPPFSWVLLLELLAALCATLLLAGLSWQGWPGSNPHLAIVIDGSASMGGGPKGATALAETLDHIQALARNNKKLQISVILSGLRPRLLSGRALPASQWASQLGSLQLTAPNHSLSPALEMLSGLVEIPEQSLIFSDNPDFFHPRLVRVGQPSPNIGIVAASWLEGESPFIVVRRFGTIDQAVPVRIIQAKQSQIIDLVAGEEIPLQLPVPTTVNQLRILLPKDALVVDNQVILLRPPKRPLGIHINHPSKPVQQALGQLLKAMPKLVSVSPEQADLSLSTVGIETAGHQLILPLIQGSTRRFAEFQMDSFSPLMVGLDPHGLVWSGQALSAPIEAKILLQWNDTPLIWTEGTKTTWNLNPERSNFFRHPAFPTFMLNLLEQQDRSRGGLLRNNLKIGEVMSFVSPKHWQEPIIVRDPSGKEERLATTEQVIGELSQVGIYQLQSGNQSQPFAVNFLDPHEGALHKRKLPTQLPKLTFHKTSDAGSSPLSQSLLLLALLSCLLGTWLLLARPDRRSTSPVI